MKPILTRAQMRAYDAHAIGHAKVPSLVLMENAGRGAAEIVAERAGEGPVAIVCGRGNNGGDGCVVARHLLARGIAVRTFVMGRRDDVKGDARANLEALVGLGGAVTFVEGEDLSPLSLEGSTVVVDALFGTGLDRELQGRYREAVARINEARSAVVALDVPSGLDADTGRVLGDCVRAELTITFGRHKAGLLQGAALERAGEVRVVGLGIPDERVVAVVGHLASFIEPDEVRATLGRRAPDTHKYRAGNVLVVAGSAGKIGAALLAARGVLRAGGGMATVATWPEAIERLEGRMEEAMTARLDRAALVESLEKALERRGAVAVGPGFGLDDEAKRICEHLLLGWRGPVIADADAISHFAGRPEALKAAPGPRVLTPHSGELARLLGSSSAAVESDRFAAAEEAAARTGATVVLKGPHTIVATGKRLRVCAAGSAVLATAGSGDVLSGMVGALLCIAPAEEAAIAAVHLHALSADRWSEGVGADRGMIASDIAEGLPDALASLFDGRID